MCCGLLRKLSLFFLCLPLAVASNVPEDVLPVTDLIKALQSGGYIIYMRHGLTDHITRDMNDLNFDECSKQRNLSENGRMEVQLIGRRIHALGIPIGAVSSSPYCRCKDTARLAFGRFNVEPDLRFSISKDEEESRQLGERLYTMMMNSEPGSKNVVFVGHTSNLRDGLGIWPKPEGVLVIFQKQDDGLVYKGMIQPDAWPDM